MCWTILTDPLRMCHRQAQDVCIPGSRCALEIPVSRSPTSTHVAFLPLGQESYFLPEPCSVPSKILPACLHVYPPSLLGRFLASAQQEYLWTSHHPGEPRTIMNCFSVLTSSAPPPLHLVAAASCQKGKSWTHYIILHSVSSSWGIRSEVIVRSDG